MLKFVKNGKKYHILPKELGVPEEFSLESAKADEIERFSWAEFPWAEPDWAPTNPEDIICGIEPSKETETEKAAKEVAQNHFDAFEKLFLFGDLPKSQNSNEEEKEMGEDMWTLYDVVAVDKDELELAIDKRVIAKTPEHAKGKAGVYELLEDKVYDDTKIKVTVARIMDIKPVEEDKE